MPINIPGDLPAASILERENIFVMTRRRAMSQDIRPLRILILNLMPTKIATETQLARLLGNTPLQVEIELMAMSGRTHKNTPKAAHHPEAPQAEHVHHPAMDDDELCGAAEEG